MIKVQHLVKTYENGSAPLYALNDVSFDITDGEFVVVLGPSGSGKSTLLNVISGLERADGGSIIYDGKDIAPLDKSALTAFRRAKTAYVFQGYYLLPTLTVTQNVKLGADLAGVKDVSDIIRAVGLEGKERRLPRELSGGEQQRVSIARALAKRPQYLFCDEPTGALDEETGRAVMRYITDIHKRDGFTLVMVTHNSNFAELSDKTIRMNSGKVIDVSVNNAPRSVDEIGW